MCWRGMISHNKSHGIGDTCVIPCWNGRIWCNMSLSFATLALLDTDVAGFAITNIKVFMAHAFFMLTWQDLLRQTLKFSWVLPTCHFVAKTMFNVPKSLFNIEKTHFHGFSPYHWMRKTRAKRQFSIMSDQWLYNWRYKGRRGV